MKMKYAKITFYNLIIFLILISLIEVVFGYWFKAENFGIYMRKERKINWLTETTFFGENHNFYYKRNYWGFRGEEFDTQLHYNLKKLIASKKIREKISLSARRSISGNGVDKIAKVISRKYG